MRNIALASLELHLVDLPTSCECEKSTPCNVCVAPMRQTKLDVVLRLQAESVACPSQQRLPLADNPVLSAIEVHCDDARYGRLGGDQSCNWRRGRNLLVEERDPNGGAPEGLEKGESGQCVF